MAIIALESLGTLAAFRMIQTVLLAMVLLAQSVEAAPDIKVIRSQQSGRWSDPATWEQKTLPQTGESVLIRTGHSVTYDVISGDVLRAIHIGGPPGTSPSPLETPGSLSELRTTTGHSRFPPAKTAMELLPASTMWRSSGRKIVHHRSATAWAGPTRRRKNPNSASSSNLAKIEFPRSSSNAQQSDPSPTQSEARTSEPVVVWQRECWVPLYAVNAFWDDCKHGFCTPAGVTAISPGFTLRSNPRLIAVTPPESGQTQPNYRRVQHPKKG